MADGDSSVEIMDKADEAFEAYFSEYKGNGLKVGGDPSGADIPIIKAFSDDEDVDAPYVAVMCDEADPVLARHDVPNFDVHVQIEVRGHAEDTTRAEQKRMAGVIGHMLWKTDMKALINALDPGVNDFTAVLWTAGKMSRFVDGPMLVNKFEGTLRCLPNDVS